MQVNFKGGKATVKLTKREQQTLRDARALSEQIERMGEMVNASGPLSELIDKYCDEQGDA